MNVPAERMDLAPGEGGVLLPLTLVDDARAPPALEQEARGVGAGDDREVLALQGGAQVCGGGAAAHPVLLRELIEADALLLTRVEIVGHPEADLARRV